MFRKFILLALLAMLLPSTALADVRITDGTDVLLIGGTNKAAGVERFDGRGNAMGQKATYSAGKTLTATAAGTAPFFTICGSATKTIRVQRFNVGGSVATAATRSTVVLTKTSTATSAGTPSTLTQVPHDSTSAAGTAGLCNYYTALATAGAAVGVVGTQTRNFAITATIASTDQEPELWWNWRGGQGEAEGIVLRGTAQCLEASFGATTTNAPSLNVAVTWTEE